ncbi:MAG: hypothetical protein ACM3ON_10830 [Chloroflexota bacterium]
MNKLSHPNLLPLSAAFVMLLSLLTLFSCATAPTLRTTGATSSEITGTYTLILFGGNYMEDLQTVAFLDKEGDQYTLAPYAPDWQYTVQKGVAAKDALAKAEQFVSINPSFRSVHLAKILDEKGGVIGYEVRPFYLSTTYGATDVLDVWYALQGTTVNIHIHLKEHVKTRIYTGTGQGKDK